MITVRKAMIIIVQGTNPSCSIQDYRDNKQSLNIASIRPKVGLVAVSSGHQSWSRRTDESRITRALFDIEEEENWKTFALWSQGQGSVFYAVSVVNAKITVHPSYPGALSGPCRYTLLVASPPALKYSRLRSPHEPRGKVEEGGTSC